MARGGFLSNALATPLARHEEKTIVEHADALIEEFGLKAVADRPAGALSFVIRKRVELARALAKGPKLLLWTNRRAGLTTRKSTGWPMKSAPSATVAVSPCSSSSTI